MFQRGFNNNLEHSSIMIIMDGIFIAFLRKLWTQKSLQRFIHSFLHLEVKWWTVKHSHTIDGQPYVLYLALNSHRQIFSSSDVQKIGFSAVSAFRPNCFDHYFYALTVEKQQIYKLTSRHRVPRCELVDLLFLKKISKMCASLWIFWPDSMNVF